MEWALAGLAVVLLAVAAFVGTGRWGAMPPVVDDRPPGRLPSGPIDAAALRQVRFSVVPRGYSMAQVDALIAHLIDQYETGHPTDQASNQIADAWPDESVESLAITNLAAPQQLPEGSR